MFMKIALATAITAAFTTNSAQADTISVGVVNSSKEHATFQSDMEGYTVRWDVAKIGRTGAYFKYHQLESESTGFTTQSLGAGMVLSYGPSYKPEKALENRRPFDFRLGFSLGEYKDAEGDSVDPAEYGDIDNMLVGYDIDVGLGLTLGRFKLGVDYGLATSSTAFTVGVGF